MSDLFGLLYRSRASHALDERDLLPILMSSLRNNVPVGVTGVLLYGPPSPLAVTDETLPPPSTVVPFEGPGVFVQWLEGPEEAVLNTFERIGQDARHTDLEILDQGAQAERLFPYWAMALEVCRTLPTSVEAVRAVTPH